MNFCFDQIWDGIKYELILLVMIVIRNMVFEFKRIFLEDLLMNMIWKLRIELVFMILRMIGCIRGLVDIVGTIIVCLLFDIFKTSNIAEYFKLITFILTID